MCSTLFPPDYRYTNWSHPRWSWRFRTIDTLIEAPDGHPTNGTLTNTPRHPCHSRTIGPPFQAPRRQCRYGTICEPGEAPRQSCRHRTIGTSTEAPHRPCYHRAVGTLTESLRRPYFFSPRRVTPVAHHLSASVARLPSSRNRFLDRYAPGNTAPPVLAVLPFLNILSHNPCVALHLTASIKRYSHRD